MNLIPTPAPWMADAVCTQVDPETFFPERGQRDKYAAAKALCQTCPVMQTCRQWAIDTREPYGVWGGLTERDRRNLRAKCKAAHSEHRKAVAARRKGAAA